MIDALERRIGSALALPPERIERRRLPAPVPLSDAAVALGVLRSLHDRSIDPADRAWFRRCILRECAP